MIVVNNKGFSIVEMSIVISIIALLVSSALGGMSLLKASKLRKLSTEITETRFSIKQFESEYSYLPGDFPSAFSFWGSECGTNDTTNTACAGDGDGLVEYNTGNSTPIEDLSVWNHMYLSEVFSGKYTGQPTSASIRYTYGDNIPASKPFSTITFAFTNNNNEFIYSKSGHSILISSLNSGEIGQGALTPANAYSIDVKIDDGLTNNGQINAIDSSLSSCLNGIEYNLSSEESDCVLHYWY